MENEHLSCKIRGTSKVTILVGESITHIFNREHNLALTIEIHTEPIFREYLET